MKFTELPNNAQHLAAKVLTDILNDGCHTEEQAIIDAAKRVKDAFTELYGRAGSDIQVGNVTVHSNSGAKDSVEDVIADFQPGELSVFHIVKIVNAVNLTIRNELAPYDNDHTDTNEAARTILKTALAALDRQQYLTGRKYGIR